MCFLVCFDLLGQTEAWAVEVMLAEEEGLDRLGYGFDIDQFQMNFTTICYSMAQKHQLPRLRISKICIVCYLHK